MRVNFVYKMTCIAVFPIILYTKEFLFTKGKVGNTISRILNSSAE